MERVEGNELKNVTGGGVVLKIVMGIVTAGSFLVGLVDGYLRPLKCRK